MRFMWGLYTILLFFVTGITANAQLLRVRAVQVQVGTNGCLITGCDTNGTNLQVWCDWVRVNWHTNANYSTNGAWNSLVFGLSNNVSGMSVKAVTNWARTNVFESMLWYGASYCTTTQALPATNTLYAMTNYVANSDGVATSCWNGATGRFTPDRAGYWYLYATARFYSGTNYGNAAGIAQLMIYKDGLISRYGDEVFFLDGDNAITDGRSTVQAPVHFAAGSYADLYSIVHGTTNCQARTGEFRYYFLGTMP